MNIAEGNATFHQKDQKANKHFNILIGKNDN